MLGVTFLGRQRLESASYAVLVVSGLQKTLFIMTASPAKYLCFLLRDEVKNRKSRPWEAEIEDALLFSF